LRKDLPAKNWAKFVQDLVKRGEFPLAGWVAARLFIYLFIQDRAVVSKHINYLADLSSV